MSNPNKTPGEVAYEGYRDHTGGLTWNGYPMPMWADLKPDTRAAWEASACAVRRGLLALVLKMLKKAQQEELQEKVEAQG